MCIKNTQGLNTSLCMLIAAQLKLNIVCVIQKQLLLNESKPVSCPTAGVGKLQPSSQLPSATYLFVNKVMSKHSHSIAYCPWFTHNSTSKVEWL